MAVRPNDGHQKQRPHEYGKVRAKIVPVCRIVPHLTHYSDGSSSLKGRVCKRRVSYREPVLMVPASLGKLRGAGGNVNALFLLMLLFDVPPKADLPEEQ